MKLNEILEKYPKTNNDWTLHTYNFGNGVSLGKRISWDYNELINNNRPLNRDTRVFGQIDTQMYHFSTNTFKISFIFSIS